MQNALRKMKESRWSAKAVEFQAAADKKDPKAFYEGLKKVYSPQGNGISCSVI